MSRNEMIVLSIIAVMFFGGMAVDKYLDTRAYEKCLEVQKVDCKRK